MPRRIHHEEHEGHEEVRGTKCLILLSGLATLNSHLSYLTAAPISFLVLFVVNQFHISVRALALELPSFGYPLETTKSSQ